MLGGATGVSLCGIILEWRLARRTATTLTDARAPAPARLAAFDETFLLLAVVCALAIVAAWRLRSLPRLAAAGSGRREGRRKAELRTPDPMCQLLGMNCNTPTDVVFSFTGFAERGGHTDHHADGWGIAFFEGARACATSWTTRPPANRRWPS